MSATVLPFPSIRRQSMIARNGQRLAEIRDPEKTLRSLVDGVRTAHERKGIDSALIAADVADFEAALRSSIIRQTSEANGAAQ